MEEMKLIDTDDDQLISRGELLIYISKGLDNLDGTEAASADESEDHDEVVDTFFKTQDLNKDGVISYEEFHAEHDEL